MKSLVLAAVAVFLLSSAAHARDPRITTHHYSGYPTWAAQAFGQGEGSGGAGESGCP